MRRAVGRIVFIFLFLSLWICFERGRQIDSFAAELEENNTVEEEGGRTDSGEDRTDSGEGNLSSGNQDVTTIPEYDPDADLKEIWTSLKLDDVDRQLEKYEIQKSIRFSTLSSEIMEGDFSGAWKVIKTAALEAVAKEISANKALLVQLIFIVLIGAVFSNLSGGSGNGFVSENGFFVTYLILTSIIFASFQIVLGIVEAALTELITVIKVLLPVYVLALSFTGSVFSSNALYYVLLICIWLVEAVLLHFILPAVKFYVVLALMNHMNKEDTFSKMTGLLRSMVIWVLKTITSVIIGVNVIKTMVAPAIDSFHNNSLSRMIGALPGGGTVTLLFGTFLGAGRLVKNSIGAAGMLLILILVLLPLIKVFILMLMVKFTSALIQPIGEKRYTAVVSVLGDGCRLLLSALGTAVVMFMLSIAVIACSGG